MLLHVKDIRALTLQFQAPILANLINTHLTAITDGIKQKAIAGNFSYVYIIHIDGDMPIDSVSMAVDNICKKLEKNGYDVVVNFFDVCADDKYRGMFNISIDWAGSLMNTPQKARTRRLRFK